MNSVYICEQKRYTKNEIVSFLGFDEDKTNSVITQLKAFGILKTVNFSSEEKDLSDLNEIEITADYLNSNTDNCYYVFTFVGVILCYGVLLKCYPKYLKNVSAPLKEMKQIIKVLFKYKSKSEMVTFEYGFDANSNNQNKLPLILFLLDDYMNNGVYNINNEIVENNYENEILWDKTIENTDPIFLDGNPCYVEFRSKKRILDDNNYISCLHKCVLSLCSKELIESELPDLFADIQTVDLSDKQLSDFGDVDYILSQIEKELNVQFNTRKQVILKSLYSYIAQTKCFDTDNSITFYGTNTFNHVWESVCKAIFDDKLEFKLKNLHIPRLDSRYKPYLEEKLVDIIDKPCWQENSTAAPLFSKKTFIPDLITILNDNFIILDAKYYNFVLKHKKLEGYPGIESISKQYFYQMAYSNFIKLNGFTKIYNCFLFPIEDDAIIDKGTVSLGFLRNFMIGDIHLKLIPAYRAFDCYINNKKIDLTELHI